MTSEAKVPSERIIALARKLSQYHDSFWQDSEWGDCIFCGENKGHTKDCIVQQLRDAVKADDSQ